MTKLGIIAGGGGLPLRLAEACRREGRPYFVLALDGFCDAVFPPETEYASVRLGAVGEVFALLKSHGVESVVLAGSVRRPSLADLRPDWRGTRLLAHAGLNAWGDDGLLRAVVKEIEAEGFRVVGAHEVLGEILAPVGSLTVLSPDEQAQADIVRGAEVARGLGRLDVGQAVVVQQGIVLGVEAIEGTDALLDRCASLRREGKGGVLVKMCKPDQDRRADLPTIGPKTVANAATAGLRGIAVHAGHSVLLEKEETVATADRLGLFIVGVE